MLDYLVGQLRHEPGRATLLSAILACICSLSRNQSGTEVTIGSISGATPLWGLSLAGPRPTEFEQSIAGRMIKVQFGMAFLWPLLSD